MFKLNSPAISYDDVLTACENEITGNAGLKTKLQNARNDLSDGATEYLKQASQGELFLLQQFTGDNPNVIKGLTKKELIDSLYSYYFRDKRAGGFYDILLATANEKCPFCGGIGHPRNLDHFMPKSLYPQFSILPLNLIPACRDCNMEGKMNNFATSKEQQILHPILDAPHFFEEQWIFARYHPAENQQPSYIDYYINPPHHWSDIDKARAHTHFKNFNIEKRYRAQSSSALVEIELQVLKLKQADININFKEVILQPILELSPFVNHWKSVMCIGLIQQL